MRSIQHRLGRDLLLLLLVVGIVAALASSWLLDLGVRRYLADHLRAESETLLLALERAPSGEGLYLNHSRVSPRYRRPLSGAYFVIASGEQQWRSRSLWDHGWQVSPGRGLVSALQEGPDGQNLLAYQAHYQRAGQPVIISVALDYWPIQQTLLQVYGLFLGLWALALLLLLALQRLTVRRALKPLQNTEQQVLQLQRGERTRLSMDVPRELEPLIGQINQLLMHTEQTLKRSRTALGNLGHALKTPLAVLQAVFARSPEQSSSQAMAQLAQIERHIARELKRARLAGEVLPGAQFDCARDLEPLLETMRMIHPRIRLESRTEQAPARLPWEREDVLEVLGNLLDNACKWAKHKVQLGITQNQQQLMIVVSDDGQGIAPDKIEQLLVRGSRLDEQVAGHGLGLSIVRDSVEAWGGQLSFAQHAEGGFAVSLTLPLLRQS